MIRLPIKKNLYYLFFVLLIAACNSETEKASLEKKLAALKKQQSEIVVKIEETEKALASFGNSSDSAYLITVQVQPVQTASYSTKSDFQATVESDNNAILSAENGGLVQKIHVREGQQVAAGQILVSLDASLIQTQIEELNKAIELAETIYAKQTRLRAQQVGTEMQYLEAKNRYESLLKQKKSAELRMSKSYIKAPFGGKVDAIFTTIGTLTGPGTPLMRIVDDGNVKIVAQVPESYVGAFKKGDKVTVSFPGISQVVEETIDAVGKVINPDNRTFMVYIRPQNKELQLKPNLLAIVSAVDFSVDSAIVIPTSIIKREANNTPYVFIAESQNGKEVIVKKQLEISKYGVDKSIVKSGLMVEDRVVVKGYNSVDVGDNVKVEVVTSSTPN